VKSIGFPPAQGLYDPRFEKDSCGVGFVADIQGRKSHLIVQKALKVLERLSHRGAQGCDPCTGDGAGILIQVPHEFYARAAGAVNIKLPPAGDYGVGMIFLPSDRKQGASLARALETIVTDEKLTVLGWRDVPVANQHIGERARESEPWVRQIFVARGALPADAFERKLYLVRRRSETELPQSGLPGCGHFYPVSFSAKTVVYKGLLLPEQLGLFYPDLAEPLMTSALGLVHSRFSTNTFPTWARAHPYRYICHNGEINTIQGNQHWMRARQGRLKSDLFGADLQKLFPIILDGQSDSACLDNAVEFLVQGGRSLAHAMMMLIPEPWAASSQMDFERRGFYEYHAAMMEPWDGPAAVCFTDGSVIGATLDRNGLRPCRYEVTDDDLVVLASEAGVLENDPARILKKGRLEPGRMFIVDTARKRIMEDEEIKSEISRLKPFRTWVTQDRITLSELPEPLNIPQPNHDTLRQRQQVFGYTVEELKMVITPMVVNGEEALSSMGNDTPYAVLSRRPQLLFKYFRQMFAQVTNPPIDSIREQLVMSHATNIGPRPNLLHLDGLEGCKRIGAPSPVLTNAEMEKIRRIHDPSFKIRTLKLLFRAEDGPKGLRAGLASLARQSALAVSQGVNFLILSDRGINAEWAPIPTLLAVSAVHQYLVRKSLRAEVGIIVESGEPRDVHHFACLIGYGAGSINPYLLFESLNDMEVEGYLPQGIDRATAHSKYVQAINKGLLKIISKMGISTLQSYCGAQIFEALGIKNSVVQRYFTGTPSRIEGIGLKEIADETLLRHREAYTRVPIRILEPGGDVHYRVGGEPHAWNPETIAKLQHATQSNETSSYREFAAAANDESGGLTNLRGLLEFDASGPPVSLAQVESAKDIVKRFTTGAMSFGSLSKEAHENLAVAMNQMGAKSNSGEGGEDPERFGTAKNSAIKQIASARFGVTAHYLVSAKELQIKMAQGAKPGEGGQLPGHKVDEVIARVRHSTAGVALISPPPHHDIYSIEDLKQLIFDLRNGNPEAEISVKLVSEAGVGTIAAGVAKAFADKVLISGDSGGTGASPLSSIKYVGMPWELGVAETHQTLVLNGLRGRIRIETDGQLKTGRDVAIAALLGAEEFGFSTAPLIAEGCIMMRKCHLNTCPVGIATQDPELRKKFRGKPEYVINYFFFVAEELREVMASLGFKTVADMIGHTEKLKMKPISDHWKASGIDLSRLLYKPEAEPGDATRCVTKQDRGLDHVLDRELIRVCQPAIDSSKPVSHELKIKNTDRTTGTLLSSQIARKYGAVGLPDDTIRLTFDGSAGQSFGAFLASGITLRVRGETNDYVGKGLSGGKIVVTPPASARYAADDTIIVGNVALFGATAGEAYFNGVAGQRFAVRNSGAHAVVEGTGDHGCEYMTGGSVVVLGRTGRNFSAGMSGGVAFVLDEDETFQERCNLGMVELDKVTQPDDVTLLRKRIERHSELTGSPRARSILSDWNAFLPRFVKVMPVDYKLALERSRRG